MIIAKVATQSFGDGENILPVRHGINDLMAGLFAEKQDLLLMTTLTKVSAFAREWQQQFVAATTATNPRKPFCQIAAF